MKQKLGQPTDRVGKTRLALNFGLRHAMKGLAPVRDSLRDRPVFIANHVLGLAAYRVRSARFSRYLLPVVPAWKRRSPLDLVLPAPIRIDRVYASLSMSLVH